MNLLIVLLFIPAAVAMFWLGLNPLLARRTSTFWLMECLTLGLLLYFISDGCYADPLITDHQLLYARLLMLGAAPCLIPILWMYFDRLINHRSFNPAQLLWVLIPVALVISGIVLTEICDKQRVGEFLAELYDNGTAIAQKYKLSELPEDKMLWHYYIWTSLFFRYVIGAEFVLASIFLLRYLIRQKARISHLWGFVFKGESIKVTELQLANLTLPALFIFLKLIFLKSFLDDNIWLSIFLAVIVSIGYSFLMVCSLVGEKETITFVQLKHMMFFNYNPSIKGPIVEIMMEELMEEADQDILLRFRDKVSDALHIDAVAPKEITAVKEQLMSTSTGSWDDSLMTRFQALMLNEQLFLQPSLSLADVAERLRTNKTYVSKMVNNTYNLGFPELLNTLRIDYAEQYILSHREAKQDEIARACGFLSASSFNNIFKKITGVTPKVWLVSMDNKRK